MDGKGVFGEYEVIGIHIGFVFWESWSALKFNVAFTVAYRKTH
jgi:hypothetical protein